MRTMEKEWHVLSNKQVVERLQTNPKSGLSEEESAERLKIHGPNAIVEEKVRRWPERLWAIVTQPFFLLIIAGSIVYALLGEGRDATFLAFMIVPLITIQFIQEGRMEKAVASLKRLSAPTAVVLRHGQAHEIQAEDVVPGDLLLIETGRLIPADSRIISANQLTLDESILTGESLPVSKGPGDGLAPDTPISDRSNMAYSGTMVVNGTGTALVARTGMKTELGKVATLMRGVAERPTPLQREIGRMTTVFGAAGLAISALVIVVGVMQARPLLDQILIAIGMAMAAIPEELPFILTVFLGLGVRRMSQRNALVKRMMGVETLGEVTIICSDKTGTMTTGKMAVAQAWVDGEARPFAEVEASDPVIGRLLEIAVRASDARFPEDKDAEPIGDPTEVALLIGARAKDVSAEVITQDGHVVDEIPFDSSRKCMVKTWERQGELESYIKGAPEVLFERSRRVLAKDGEKPFDDDFRMAAAEANRRLAGSGLRVLALAYGRPDAGEPPDENLTLVGLVGIEDPLRPEVKGAVDECRRAGIRVAMITGDQVTTALTVARAIGVNSDGRALTGREIDSMDAGELKRAVREVTVYARVSPQHKLRIVEALLDNREVVAMTGDGVNDAPALKKADIGVAMGERGTDVAREAASMVLVDDNFASIVSAVRDGRTIYDNLRKATRYVVGLHVALLGIPLAATFLGYVSPLLPASIILMELILDPMSSVVFEGEPAEPNLMTRPPRRPGQRLIDWRLGGSVLAQGATILLAALGVYIWSLSRGTDVDVARTLSLSTLILSQLLLAVSVRSERRSIFELKLSSNRYFPLAAGLIFAILIGVVYVPFLQALFHTAAFEPRSWLIVLGISILATGWVEIPKAIRRKLGKGA
ncbi:MAG: cation-transporting P-type ATPase [Actinobacteria bacterium]|nr:cation-transporting P-type ATPase [Actinomycetota bacterium]